MLGTYKTILPYLGKYKINYIVGIFFLMLVDAAQVLIPRFIKQAIDTIARGDYKIEEIARPALAMVGIAAVISVGRFLWRFFIVGASRRIEREMRDKLMNHMVDMSSDFFQANKIGDLMARATNDMNAVRQATAMGFVSLVDGVFMSSMILIAMFTDSPHVALFTIIPLPLVTVLILFFGRIVGGQFKKVQEIYSRMSDIAQETISGLRVVKAFVKEKFFSTRFQAANVDYEKAFMALVRTFGFFFPLISFLAGLSTAILLGVGGTAVLKNRMSPGDIIAMLSYLDMLVWPLMGAGFTVNIIQRGGASLKRINEIYDARSSIAVEPNALKTIPTGDLVVRNLNFTYPGANKPALENISFELARGSTLGILGRIGSGKSTLLKILPRLLDPGKGSVFIGGEDICFIEPGSLRMAFGVVPQESFLFSDSLRRNIVFGNPGISGLRFEKITSTAALDRDLYLFPSGWETIVGEKGLTLSGGQKQRVAIARALAVDPEILVMDDSLSAVDSETEEKILKALLEERTGSGGKSGRTNIIVSHRVSTLRHSDWIIVLDAGKVIQSGTHGELLSDTEGFYAEIARLQELEAEKGAEAKNENTGKEGS
jgi:ATP-binding cassette subfamily B protein